MYLIEAFFALKVPTITDYALVNQIIEQWRYNGQILGREIPLFQAKLETEQGVAVRVVCPEQQSLLPEFNSINVQKALDNAENAGIIFDSFQIIADDLNSDINYQGEKPSWQVLYTTYLQSCSPLHSGDDNLPIPLYKLFKNTPHLSLDIIKWQENWQACDQLQMNGTVLEQSALEEISDIDSNLSKHGYALCKEIEQHTQIPTYYYLYRIGGESLNSEKERCCPRCQRRWLLNRPLFDLFYFKCDHCRLVSNLSWNWQ